MSLKRVEDNIFDRGFNKGRELGYIEALRDILNKEELVIMLVDDGIDDQGFQTQALVVESKHVRMLLRAMTRDRDKDN